MEKESFINYYQALYFSDYNGNIQKLLGKETKSLHTTDRAIESFIFGDDDKKTYDKIEPKHIAWKAGRISTVCNNSKVKLDCNEEYYWDGLNGYGRTIGNSINDIKEFLNKINKSSELLEAINEKDIEKSFIILNNIGANEFKNKIFNIGPVYYFSIIFFLSKYKFPIYDIYAHTAVKALYFKENPKNIFVGSAPSRDNPFFIPKTIGMYKEYLWYLERLFGTYSIPRKIDRSLWVYGHATEK